MDSDNVYRWYIFYCRSRSEKKVHEYLLSNHYQSYLPLVEVERQWSDRKKKVIIPMISGYIFVFCKLCQIYDIVQAPNVVASVKIGTERAYLMERDVVLLKKIEEENLFKCTEPIKILKGQLVRVKSGPLAGFEGVFEHSLGQGYLLINVDAIGKSIKAHIQMDSVEKI